MEVPDKDQQKKYHSGIRMLLYLENSSRPVVRVFSECMDGATWGAYHEMLRVIKFEIDTKDLGLKIEPKGELK
jgi:hypothetical protein